MNRVTIYSLEVPILNQSFVPCLVLTVAFLNFIQVSREAGKVVWYSHFFKNFLKFVVIHTVKGFSIINEAEVDISLEFCSFLYDPMDIGNLISGFSAFLNPAYTSGSSWFTYCWRLAWRILSITLLTCEMSATNYSLSSLSPEAGIMILSLLINKSKKQKKMEWNGRKNNLLK